MAFWDDGTPGSGPYWSKIAGFRRDLRSPAPPAIYCASVSRNLRCVSPIVRPTPTSVSDNVRRKWPSIARRTVYYCAPLHIAPPTFWTVSLQITGHEPPARQSFVRTPLGHSVRTRAGREGRPSRGSRSPRSCLRVVRRRVWWRRPGGREGAPEGDGMTMGIILWPGRLRRITVNAP